MKAFWVLSLLVSLTARAQTFTVDLNAGVGLRDLRTSANVPVADGNSVELGYFATGFDVGANAGDITALRNAWTLFTSTPVQTIFGEPGRFSTSESSADDSYTGRKIYLWAFKTSDNGAPQPDLSNVEESGLFSSSAPTWVFPSRFAFPPANSTAIDSNDPDEGFLGGSFNGQSLLLAPVPEPAEWAAITGALLLAAAFARRSWKC